MMSKIPPDCFGSLQDWEDYVERYYSALDSRHKMLLKEELDIDDALEYDAAIKDLISRADEEDINFCLDCTPYYQKEMVKQGKCAFPNTKFINKTTNGETELVGMRPLNASTYLYHPGVLLEIAK